MSGISNFLAGLFTTLKTAEEKVLLPDLASAVSALAASPSLLTLQAQGGLLLAKAVAAQPNIAQGLLTELSATLTALGAEIEPATPVPAPAPAATAAKAA